MNVIEQGRPVRAESMRIAANGIKEGVGEAMKYYTNVKTYSLPWPVP
jgi:hypothetical protein